MPELLEVNRVSRSFGGVRANSDINLTVSSGTIRCVIGPNGAGKSTLVSMLSGHLRPDVGTIRLKGKDITGWPAHRVARAGVVRKFQRPSFYPDLSVMRNLEVAVLARGVRGRAVAPAVEQVAETVGLLDALGVPALHLPHGRTQWLEIGLLVAREPEVMLLDEPTAGMTTQETDETATLIRRLVEDRRMSAIVIEHDMGFVRALEAPVTVLHLGSVIASGSMQEVESHAQVRAVYLGEELEG